MAEALFLPGADDDYRSALRWYAEQGPHLADAFEVAVDEALSKIASGPHRFARYDERHRCFPLRRFPYALIYRSDGDQVIVVGVAHGKRRPGYWKKRAP